MLASALLAGCVEDNGYCADAPDNPSGGNSGADLQEITVNVASRSDYEDGLLQNEKIHNYWMVFVNYNDNNKIVAATEVNLDRPVEADVVNVKVPNGSYKVYAFANISRQTVCEALGIPLSQTSVNVSFPAESVVKAARIMYADGGRKLAGNWALSANIPMSAIETVNVTKNTNQGFAIGLYRMLAKIEYEFTAVSTKKITVRSLQISPVTDCAIPLLTSYNTSLGVPNGDFTITSTENLTVNINPGGSDNQIPANDRNKKVTGHFYIPESLSGKSGFLLTVGYSRDNSPERTDYATTYDATAITRNSILRLPIVITDYKVTVDPLVDAPIGGYAPETESVDEQGCSVSYIGASKAKFRVNIFNVDGGARLSSSAYNLSFESGADNILFEEEPVFEKSSGTIRFNLKNITREAKVRVKITVRATNQSYIRIITIKNTKK